MSSNDLPVPSPIAAMGGKFDLPCDRLGVLREPPRSAACPPLQSGQPIVVICCDH